MYWNEINPKKRKVSFEFDGPDLKKDNYYTQMLILFKKQLVDLINLFFMSSNIHGFNHLADGSRHVIEKYVFV